MGITGSSGAFAPPSTLGDFLGLSDLVLAVVGAIVTTLSAVDIERSAGP